MNNLFEETDTLNKQHLKTDFTQTEKERRKLQREIELGKRLWHHSPYECFEQMEIFKNRNIKFLREDGTIAHELNPEIKNVSVD